VGSSECPPPARTGEIVLLLLLLLPLLVLVVLLVVAVDDADFDGLKPVENPLRVYQKVCCMTLRNTSSVPANTSRFRSTSMT